MLFICFLKFVLSLSLSIFFISKMNSGCGMDEYLSYEICVKKKGILTIFYFKKKLFHHIQFFFSLFFFYTLIFSDFEERCLHNFQCISNLCKDYECQDNSSTELVTKKLFHTSTSMMPISIKSNTTDKVNTYLHSQENICEDYSLLIFIFLSCFFIIIFISLSIFYICKKKDAFAKFIITDSILTTFN